MHTYSTTPQHKKQLRVGLLGARGYSGMELARSLLQHPFIASLHLGINEGQIKIEQWLPESVDKTVQLTPVAEFLSLAANLDLVFLATPAEVSMEWVPKLLAAKLKVIDLSGAFRLQDPKMYPQWYGFEHQCPELLAQAQYGLSPFNRLEDADSVCLVANPGCYATAIQMALMPLIKNNLLNTASLVIDAKSGTTGAGKKASESQLYAEVDGECLPYKIGHHQHYPEICQSIEQHTQVSIAPIFSTSLIPVRRGIIAGIYGYLAEGVTNQQIDAAFEQSYLQYPLVRWGQADQVSGAGLLSLKKVVGSARTHIAFTTEKNKLYLYSSIDNLMKGAASQAIENMNYLFSWPLQTGLLHREGLL